MRRLAWVLSIATGCSGGGGGDTQPGDSGTQDDQTGACVRDPAPADRVRYVVVSHPYNAASMASNGWEVLALSTTGELSRPNKTFTMGRAFTGELAFTRDGEIGVAAQDDGTLGVFKLAEDGTPTVIHANLMGSFYAGSVFTGPDGTIYVLDMQWRENGGGIYKLAIDCNDNVTDGGLVAASKLPAGIEWLPNSSTALLAATDIGTSPMGAEAHALNWTGGDPAVLGSVDLFPDDEAIIGSTALTGTGQYFLAGDTSGFASVPNRVAVASINSGALGTVEMIPMVEDPLALVADPDSNTVLAVSGFGDAMFTLDRPNTMWRKREVTYQGASPQLPSGAVLITRGMLRGRVLVAELSGVRQAHFISADVDDIGLFSLGMGIENTTGAIGVTP